MLRRIGSGSYGEVWLAKNILGEHRAVKVVYRNSFEDDRPFQREFKGIQKFEPISRSHPSQLAILHVGRNEPEDYFYYVMELADGEEMQNEECKMKNEAAANPTASNFQKSILNYRPKTLRSLLRPNSQRSTLPSSVAALRRVDNPQPTKASLPPAECVAIGLALAEALTHLHKHGLVHRDIKPSNIIFVGGVPKLADIGLVTDVDASRSFVGTEGYLPPEGPGTPQADIYSLGKVLYELCTGKDRKDYPALPPDLRERPASEQSELLELNAVLVKACASDAHLRYQSAEEMHGELALLQRGQSVRRERTQRRRWGIVKKYGFATAVIAFLIAGVWLLSNRFDVVKIHPSDAPASSASAPVAIKTIAVLPFDNESPDKADEYLGAEMADRLRSTMSRIPELRVLGGESAAALKSAKDVRMEARQYGLTAWLSGKVRKTGGRLYVTAQLLNTADGFVLWSEPYDRDLSEIFGIQTEIALKIAGKLNLKLTDTDRARLAIKPTKNLEAYQLYMEGRHYWNLRPTRAAGWLKQSMERFRAATDKDPSFALAFTGLADCYITGADMMGSPKQSLSNALAIAEKAVQLDPELAEAHTSLARAKYHLYDWNGAEEGYQQALRLNTNYATAHQWYAKYLSCQGRFDEAIMRGRIAKELDPGSLYIRNSLSWTLYDARKYEEAEEEFRRLLEVNQGMGGAWDALGWCCVATGREADAIGYWEKGHRIRGMEPEKVAALTEAFKQEGTRGYARKRLEQLLEQSKLGFTNYYFIAVGYADIGEKDQAFQWLDMAYEERYPWMPLVAVEYRLYTLHSDPRFAALLKKMELKTPVWKQ